MENKKIIYIVLGTVVVLGGIWYIVAKKSAEVLNNDGYPLKIDVSKIV